MIDSSPDRVLKLNAEDAAVWQRTMDACDDSQTRRPSLAVRCRSCGSELAAVGTTAFGTLFSSAWDVERPLDFTTTVNGHRLKRRDALRFQEATETVISTSGPPMDYKDREGTIALLALPAEMIQDYPDLLVRCAQHGDALLSRDEIFDDLRERRAVRKVDPAFPLRSYICPPQDRPGGRRTRSSETRRITPSPTIGRPEH